MSEETPKRDDPLSEAGRAQKAEAARNKRAAAGALREMAAGQPADDEVSVLVAESLYRAADENQREAGLLEGVAEKPAGPALMEYICHAPDGGETRLKATDAVEAFQKVFGAPPSKFTLPEGEPEFRWICDKCVYMYRRRKFPQPWTRASVMENSEEGFYARNKAHAASYEWQVAREESGAAAVGDDA